MEELGGSLPIWGVIVLYILHGFLGTAEGLCKGVLTALPSSRLGK